MSPMQQIFLGLGAVAKKTYMDDVFSTFLYTGTGSAQTINNGIDLAGEGGMVWFKSRTTGGSSFNNHSVVDTARVDSSGRGKSIYPNLTEAEYSPENTNNITTSFNSNGYTTGTNSNNSTNTQTLASWTFRKTPGFFDVVTWTGNGTSGRTISHSLGSVPGCIMVKCTSAGNNWGVYHRGTTATDYLQLNTTAAAAADSGVWNNTEPTSTEFTVGDGGTVNDNGDTYVAYLFAGGASTAATARSVDFDGNDRLTLAATSDFDFGTGDWTVEGWWKSDHMSDTGDVEALFSLGNHSNAGGMILYQYNNKLYLGKHANSISFNIPNPFDSHFEQWLHVALVKSGTTVTLYVNGTDLKSYTDSGSYGDGSNNSFYIGCSSGGHEWEGWISNLRVVKGTAVYTSSFRPPTEPLTNITNTKLLCCNNSSTTGSTVTPGTITAAGDPTASTDIPFDDTAAHIFGKSGSENLIKCGSYVGNGSATHRKIELGFEPQWIMTKRVSGGTSNWDIADMMRGTPADDGNSTQNGSFLWANQDWAEATDRPFTTHSTGFGLKNTSSGTNGDGDTYIYMAIRRPDGYVGKPADAGTGVFTMDTGNGQGNTTPPEFTSGFPVDFAFYKRPATSDEWITSARLIQGKYLQTQTTSAEGSNSAMSFDNNTGWDSDNLGSNYQSWMFKRHAGFDVVTYKGDGVSGRQVPHSLNKTVEMMWVKNRGAGQSWSVWHKGLNGGVNVGEYYLILNATNAEGSAEAYWQDTAPTSTSFTLGNSATVNSSGNDYIAMLFSSVDGISKVGSYEGSNSPITITTGFQPRFFFVKRYDYTGNWTVFDTVRGWGSGADCKFEFNTSGAQNCNTDFGYPTSTGIYLTNDPDTNLSGRKFIYYAHA